MPSTSKPYDQERSIRVFISSTFRDMQGERDELVKRVFPQLRKMCEQRSVTWGEVDLRWGITEEQKGEVLPICLEEIQRCRPYFLGLLGERYGWIPDEISDELVEQHPWLHEHQGSSVTELEILHGVLNNPKMADHAFFYFRDPGYIETLPAEQQPTYREIPASEEIEYYGPAESEERARLRRQKLSGLKEMIRTSGFPLRENYPTPQVLGEWVLADLGNVIEQLFPAGGMPDALDQEVLGHETFARSRHGVYVSDSALIETLNQHVQGQDPPLTILGESGSGKSALLANWVLSYPASQPGEVVLFHFVGATPGSSDWMTMVRRFMAEFNRHFNLGLLFPLEPEALRVAFANSLHGVSNLGRVILIIDGLDQLDDYEGAHQLAWLPEEMPNNIRVILSTLPHGPGEEIQRRKWPMLWLRDLEIAERKQLIQKFLAQYAKSLSPDRIERIATPSPSANPLYLRTVLEELRLFGLHERLDDRIEECLSAKTIPALFQKILQRYEMDYEGDRPCLVRDATTLMLCSRQGLAESELLELLGSMEKPLPHAFWSPLRLALEGSLINRSGIFQFSHPYFEQAVQERYLAEPMAKKACHHRLADYFQAHDLSSRVVTELPWQWEQAQAWDKLYELLADVTFFCEAWDRDSFGAQSYWAAVESHSSLRVPDAYENLMTQPAATPAEIRKIAHLMQNMGYLDQALQLQEFLIQRHREIGESDGLALALGNAAIACAAKGDLQKALDLFRQEVGLCHDLGDERGRARSLFNQANILRSLGELQGANELYRATEEFWRQIGDRESIVASLGNRGHILRGWGDLDGAMALFEEKERLSRQFGNRLETARALSGQATIHFTRGLLDQAEALFVEEERMLRELGSRADLATCIGNQAILRGEQGDPNGAMKLYRQQEDICRQVGETRGIAESLGRQGTVHLAWGNLEAAMSCFQSQEQICRQLGLKDELQVSLGNQALVLKARGDLDGAWILQEEKASICRELGNKKGLAIALGNQANILALRGNLRGAMVLQKEKENIERELGNIAGLALCLGNQAGILLDMGEPLPAIDLLRQQEQLYRRLGNPDKLARSLVAQSNILARNLAQPQAAIPLLEEAVQLALRSGADEYAQQVKQILDLLRGSAG